MTMWVQHHFCYLKMVNTIDKQSHWPFRMVNSQHAGAAWSLSSNSSSQFGKTCIILLFLYLTEFSTISHLSRTPFVQCRPTQQPLNQPCGYFWWTKSCTTWDDEYPRMLKDIYNMYINIFTIYQLVSPDFIHQQYQPLLSCSGFARWWLTHPPLNICW